MEIKSKSRIKIKRGIGLVRLVGLVGLITQARGADVIFKLQDFTTVPQKVRALAIYPIGTPYTNGAGFIVTRDRVLVSTGTNGSVTVSNVYGGGYRSELLGTYTLTTNFFLFPISNGVINASDWTIGLTNGLSGANTAYSQNAADGRFVHQAGDTMSGGLTNNVIFSGNGAGLTNVTGGLAIAAGTNGILVSTNGLLRTVSHSGFFNGPVTVSNQFGVSGDAEFYSTASFQNNVGFAGNVSVNGQILPFGGFGGVLYGDGSGLTNLPVASQVWTNALTDIRLSGDLLPQYKFEELSIGTPKIDLASTNGATVASISAHNDFSLLRAMNGAATADIYAGSTPSPVLEFAIGGANKTLLDPGQDNFDAPYVFDTMSPTLVTGVTHTDFRLGGTSVFKLNTNGDIYWVAIGLRPPATNALAGQALVSDGGTPQQLSYQSFTLLPTNSASDGQVVSSTGDQTKWITPATSGGDTFISTNIYVTNLYSSNLYATNIYSTTFNGHTVITTNIYSSNAFFTNVYVSGTLQVSNLTSGTLLTLDSSKNLTNTDLTGDITTSGALATSLKNTGTAGTYTKTTFDAQGRETSGTTLSAGDIPAIPESGVTSLVTDLSQRASTNDSRSLSFSGANTFSGVNVFSNAVRVDAAHAFSPSNASPSKVAVIGADNTLTNSGLGAVPINGDGSATTSAQLQTLLPAIVVTNGDNRTSLSLSNSEVRLIAGNLLLTNPVVAISGTQSKSPPLVLAGHGFGTSGSASQPVNFLFDSVPVQGTTPTGLLVISNSINGGALAEVARFGSSGTLNTPSTITAGGIVTGNGFSSSGGAISAASANVIQWSGRTEMQSPVDGGLEIENQAGSVTNLHLSSGGNMSIPGAISVSGAYSNNVRIDASHSLSLSNMTASLPLFLNSDNTVTQLNVGTGLSLSGNTLSSSVSAGQSVVQGTNIVLTTNGSAVTIDSSSTPQFSSIGVGIAAASSGYLSPANLVLSNNVAATSGAQKQSPALRMIGNGWDTVAGASKPLEFSNTVVTVSGANNPIGTNITSVAVNNAAATIIHQEDYVGNETFAGDINLGTSGGSHRMTLTGPHGASGWSISSDSASTLSAQLNASSIQMAINGAHIYQFTATSFHPGDDNTEDCGAGAGATARWRDVVLGRAITNDINGAGSGASVTMPSGGGIASNGNGSDMNVIGSQATGTGRSGAIITRTAPTFQSSGSTVNSLVVRSYLSPKRVNLTETTATLVFNVSLASGKFCGLHVFATTHATDATDFQSTVDEFFVSAVNKGGTVTTGISTIGTSATATAASSASTLTTAWTAVANGAGVDIKNNATSSLTQTVLATYWRVEIDTDDTALAVTPQ